MSKYRLYDRVNELYAVWNDGRFIRECDYNECAVYVRQENISWGWRGGAYRMIGVNEEGEWVRPWMGSWIYEE